VSADGVSVFNDHGRLTTIDGMVSAVDGGTGEILWQRPAYDGIKGTIGTGQAFGTLTVGNGVVFIGYQDGQGTMVALDADSGRKLFEFHNQIKLADGSVMRSGAVEGGPQVVGNMVYWVSALRAVVCSRTGTGSTSTLEAACSIRIEARPRRRRSRGKV